MKSLAEYYAFQESDQCEYETEYLYRYYNDLAPVGQQLLYIGITSDFVRRDHSHWRNSWRWRRQATRFWIEPHVGRRTVQLAEFNAIQAEVPLHNTTHQDVDRWIELHREYIDYLEFRDRSHPEDVRIAQIIGDIIFGKAAS